ncbi:MAG: hypothetical protein IJ067_11840 [Prevotella sp.]|nr:hypothetical protein [Prevotella sp.]
MKKIFNAFLMLAMVITAGMSLTSCTSNDDNPTTPQNSLAQQLVGEWIFELETDGIEDYDFDEDTKALAEEAKIAVLYHFFSNGTCWKEINLMLGDELMNQPVGRYATEESTYTIDASGRVVIAIKDADTGIDQSEELTFDGTRLTIKYADADVPFTLERATDAQTQFYKAESDAWHGGSDDGGGDAVGHPLSESVLGEIVGTDGKAYAVADRDNLPGGVSAAGMVAYKDGTHGLAIALKDESSTMRWDEAIGKSSTMKWYMGNGKSGAAAHKPAVHGQTWKLPSKDEWEQMFKANGGSETHYTGLNTAISNAGGTPLRDKEDDYWSSTERIPGYAYSVNIFEEDGAEALIDFNSEEDMYYVRACFAF